MISFVHATDAADRKRFAAHLAALTNDEARNVIRGALVQYRQLQAIVRADSSFADMLANVRAHIRLAVRIMRCESVS